MTPWLKVLGKGAPAVPVVEVELRRSGEELLGVVAQVWVLSMNTIHSPRVHSGAGSAQV